MPFEITEVLSGHQLRVFFTNFFPHCFGPTFPFTSLYPKNIQIGHHGYSKQSSLPKGQAIYSKY